MQRASRSSGFTEVPSGDDVKISQELRLTGGMIAWLAIGTIIIILILGCAAATLVLVGIRFHENCCEHVKDTLEDDILPLLSFLQNCIPVGSSGCAASGDCCPQPGTIVQCNNGTCQPLVMS